MSEASKPHPLIRNYSASVPHCEAMGMQVTEVGQQRVTMRLPYAEHLLGDAQAQLIHTSVQLSLVDSCFGAVVLLAVNGVEAIATMDLRLDYQRPAVAPKDLFVEAWIDQFGEHVVFVSGMVWQEDRSKPTCLARGTFMRASSSKPVLVEVQA